MSLEKRSENSKTFTSLELKKDIWTLMSLKRQALVAEASKVKTVDGKLDIVAKDDSDTYTIIIGSPGSGKTSIASAFKNSSKPDDIKPSTALEYTFLRLKASKPNERAIVGHIWELATTKCLYEMIHIPLSTYRILQANVVITLDLSDLGDVVPYCVKWLLIISKVVKDVLAEREKQDKDQSICEALRQAALGRYKQHYGTEEDKKHPDLGEVTPCSIPILIVANKYDTFRDEDSIKRRGIVQSLRYFAHLYGAHLLFTSTKDKTLVTQFRSIMKNFTFRSFNASCFMKSAKEIDTMGTKSIYIPAGCDTFEDIGLPKGSSSVKRGDSIEDKARPWLKAVTEYYVPSGKVNLVEIDTSLNTPPSDLFISTSEQSGERNQAEKYPHAAIDQVCALKREELERYRTAQLRKKEMQMETNDKKRKPRGG